MNNENDKRHRENGGNHEDKNLFDLNSPHNDFLNESNTQSNTNDSNNSESLNTESPFMNSSETPFTNTHQNNFENVGETSDGTHTPPQPERQPQQHNAVPRNPYNPRNAMAYGGVPMSPVLQKDWGLRKILASVFAVPMMFLLMVALMIPVVFTMGVPDITTSLILTIVCEIGVLFWGLWITGALGKIKETLYLKNFSWKNIGIGAGFGALLFIGLQTLSIGLSQLGLSKVESSDTSTSLSSLTGIEQFIILLIVVPFIVPVIEELFFRGYIFGFLRNSERFRSEKVAFWTALLVSSFIFAVMHAQGFSTFSDFFIIGWIFIVALVNAKLLEKTQSIYTAMASHVTYNFITAILGFIASSAA